MILSGAGLIEASKDQIIYQHVTETVDKSDVTVDGENGTATIKISKEPYLPSNGGDNFAYVMFVRDGEIISEPYIPEHVAATKGDDGKFSITVNEHNCYDDASHVGSTVYKVGQLGDMKFDSVIVDFYVAHKGAAKQIEITPDKFGGNYYLEASTLFRDQNGVDMPAEFIIPNCKIQSNFTFTMASSGDPSSFTFTMDAFPDYTRFDHSKKVLAAIQIIEEAGSQDLHRGATPNGDYAVDGAISGVDPHEDLLTERLEAANG